MRKNLSVLRLFTVVGQRENTCFVRPSIYFSPINLVLLILGTLIHLVAEGSFLPILTSIIYFYAGIIILYVTRLTNYWERRIYTHQFLVGFFVAGLSALFRTFAFDSQGDAANFFDIASDLSNGMSLFEISLITEGSIAVVLWREVFNFMTFWGFPRQPFIGILVNVLIVALAAVVTQRMALMIYGNDEYRSRRLLLMFSLCGVFWIFSGLLLRDSVVLLALVLLTCAWIFFLKKPDIRTRFFFVIGCSVLASGYMGLMRTDFIFIPLAMAISSVAALMIPRNNNHGRLKKYLLFVFGILIIFGLFEVFSEELLLRLLSNRMNYNELAFLESQADSFGYSIVVNQPILLRIFLGSIYLFVMPIPFWSGLQLESAYALFKTFNSIYFSFIIPLLIISIRCAWRDISPLRPIFLFLAFSAVGFTMTIAGTSLETRHHAAFFPIFFLLALGPDLRVRTLRRQYTNLTVFLLLSLLMGHLLWLILKRA